MIMNRRSHHLGWLLIILSILSWKAAYAVPYTANAGVNNFSPATPPGFPPAQFGAGDSLTVVAGGTVNAVGAPAVRVQAGATGAVVSTNFGAPGGIIISNGAATIQSPGADNPFIINNDGRIENTIPGNPAIDLSGCVAGALPTINTTGIIQSNIILPGAVIGTINVNGGNINGNISQALGSASVLNINTNFSLGGTVSNIANIHLVNSGTVFNTLANTMSGFTTLTIDAGTTLNAAAALAGTSIINNGTFNLNAGGNITAALSGTGALNLNTSFATVSAITGTQAISVNTGTFTIQDAVAYSSLVNNSTVTLNPGGSISGGMSSSSPASVYNINTSTTTTGAISDVKTITVTGATLTVVNPITGYNTLTLTAGAAPLILNAGGSLASSGAPGSGIALNDNTLTVNSGTITGDITGGALSNIILNTNFGTAGNINTLSNMTVAAGTTFTVNGGNTVAVTNLNDLGTTLINGGTLNAPNIAGGGVVTLSSGTLGNTTVTGGTVNIQGGTAGSIAGTSTINLSGGAVGPITGAAAVHVLGNFTTTNPISIAPSLIDVQNNAIFTVNNPITSGGLTVGVGATTNLNAVNTGPLTNNGLLNLNAGSDITGTFTNNGSLALANATRAITGAFVQNGTGLLNTTIDTNPAVYGNITAAAGSSFSGSVALTLNNSANITNGATFDIVRAPGLIVGPTTIIAPPSATLSFTQSPANDVYRIMANRTPLSSPGFLGNVLGVGAALEQIRASGTATPLQALILQRLDQLSTAEQVQLALLQLSPEANGGTLLSTMQMNELPFLKITRGLHSMRAANDYSIPTGYNAGDIADGRGSYGPFVFAGNTTIKQKNGIPGFNALGSGVGFVADVPVTGYGPFCGSPFLTKVGAAGSYAGTRLRNNPNVMDSNITSWQGILYFTVDYNLFFMDGTVAWATNHYINTRHTFLGQNARGDFYGEQKTSRLNVGLNLPMGNLEIAPYFTTRNLRITQNPYVEKGAPGENLSIKRRTAISQQGGGGVRFFDVSQIEDFLPEVHVLFLTELKSPNLSTQAIFVEGSPSFLTLGPPLSKQSVVFGFSASGIVVPGLVVTLAYDLETRNNFWSNYGSIKVRWIF